MNYLAEKAHKNTTEICQKVINSTFSSLTAHLLRFTNPVEWIFLELVTSSSQSCRLNLIGCYKYRCWSINQFQNPYICFSNTLGIMLNEEVRELFL